MHNVGFLRTPHRVHRRAVRQENEVSEIWITFPDPQLKTRRAKKRLTSPLYLACYARCSGPDGWINLKTDSKHLYAYTGRGQPPLRAALRRGRTPTSTARGSPTRCSRFKTAYETRFPRNGSCRSPDTRFALGDRREFPRFDWEGRRGRTRRRKTYEAERQLR